MLVLRLWKVAFTFYMVFCKSALSERKRERVPDTVWLMWLELREENWKFLNHFITVCDLRD